MNKSNMGVHNSLLGCLIITLITLQLYTGVHNSDMLLEIALSGSLITTLITVVLDTLVFGLDVSVQGCLVSSFIITSVAMVGEGSFVGSLLMDLDVSDGGCLEGANITGVLEPLMLVLDVIAQTRLGCESLPTVRAGR